MDRSLLSMVIVFFVLGISFFIFEKSRFSSKEIAVIAVLATLAALGRVPFAAIPSAQPTTFLVIVSGFVFGSRAGFLVGAVAALVSNVFLGQGPWTIFQMLTWGLCGISSGLLGRFFPRANKKTLVIFGIIWGYLFGWILNTWYWYSFVYPLTFQSWLLTNAASFWFDTIHAVTNAFFLSILGSEFCQILHRFRKRLSFSYKITILETKT